MGGTVLFQDALASRLNIMGLSQQRLDDFLKAHPAQITPGMSYQSMSVRANKLGRPWGMG